MMNQGILFMLGRSAGPILIAVLVLHGDLRGGAGGSVRGSVKIPGLASNADAIVYVQQVATTFAPPAKPVEMDQRGKQFIPHVLPVVVGTTVRFLNNDPTRHNVFSPAYEKYNLGTWRQGLTKDHTFETCAKAPCVYVQLCLLHPEMEAYVAVLQNPFFATTGSDGQFEINEVPPGSYMLAVWHAKAKAQAKPVTIDPAKPAVVDFVLGR
jgi:plastocyanin